jgi:TonB family protein
LVAALGLTLAAPGCATSDAARLEQEREERVRAWNDKHSAVHSAEESEAAPDAEPAMTVSGDEGTLNAEDVEAAISLHRAELLECYGLGRRSSQRAYGHAMLRFFVDGKGEVQDVAILESNIGNKTIERCLADIAVGVTMHAPAGRKPTTFDYPIDFRPSTRAPIASRGRR